MLVHKNGIVKSSVLIGLIVVSYFGTRVFSIRDIPIFLDESIYALWAQQGYFNADDRLISLVDGKQPLFIWLVTLGMKWIPSPLAAGRIVSVIAGFLTIPCIYSITRQLFEKKIIAYCAIALFILWPYGLVIQRLALYESFVGLLLLLFFSLQIRIIHTLRRELGYIAGFILGALALTKTTVLFAVLLIPTMYVLLPPKKQSRQEGIAWLGIQGITISIALGMTSILHLSSKFSNIWEKSSGFLYSLDEFRRIGWWHIVSTNSIDIFEWLVSYTTVPVLLLGLLSFAYFQKLREKFILASWILIPLSIHVILGKNIYPRYLYPFALFMIPLIAYGMYSVLTSLRVQWVRYVVAGIILVPIVTQAYMLTYHPHDASYPPIDRYQYYTGWPSGDGSSSIVSYVLAESHHQEIVVITEGIYSSLPTNLMYIYSKHSTTIDTRPIDHLDSGTLDPEILSFSCQKPTYLFLNKWQGEIDNPVEEIITHRKGGDGEFIRLYKILPDVNVCLLDSISYHRTSL